MSGKDARAVRLDAVPVAPVTEADKAQAAAEMLGAPHPCGCGRERQVEPHTCPYAVEIRDDLIKLCTCCLCCQQECADDI